jgi:hypothetical protein
MAALQQIGRTREAVRSSGITVRAMSEFEIAVLLVGFIIGWFLARAF